MRSAVLCVAITASSFALLAQQRSEWKNPELIAKGIPQSQYFAIGRGFLSQCNATSAAAVRKMLAAWQSQCIATYGVGPLCGYQGAAKQQEAVQMQRDMVDSCMSEKGWFWLPVEP